MYEAKMFMQKTLTTFFSIGLLALIPEKSLYNTLGTKKATLTMAAFNNLKNYSLKIQIQSQFQEGYIISDFCKSSKVWYKIIFGTYE